MSDSTTLLDTLSASDSQKEVTANELFAASSPATAFGRHDSACTGLTWAYYGGKANVSGTPTAVANGTITLTDNATNYIYLSSAGAVTKTTSIPSGWPASLSGSTPLYTVVVASGASTYTDYRMGLLSGNAATVGNFVGDNGGSPNSGAAGLVPAPNQGDSAKYLKGDGTWATVSASVSNFVGDDGGSPNSGVAGAVPAPNQGDASKFLKGDGTWTRVTRVLQVACSDMTTAITAGAGSPQAPAMVFRAPYAMTLTAVRASLATESSSGAPRIDIQKNGVSILSTALTIDASERSSTTAATPPVISTAAIADDDELEVVIVSAGTGAKGLVVALIGY